MRPSATESLLRELEAKYGEEEAFLPRDMLIRPLVAADAAQVTALEAASYSPDEAASAESVAYRLSVCPEICAGLFKREYTWEYRGGAGGDDDEDFDNAKSVVSSASNLAKEQLVGFILATKTDHKFVTHEDMEVGAHNEAGRTIVVHSVCVAEEFRKRSLGHIMLVDYIQKFFGLCTADGIAIIARPQLKEFYERVGFRDGGVSEVKHGNGEWLNMRLPFDTYDDEARH